MLSKTQCSKIKGKSKLQIYYSINIYYMSFMEKVKYVYKLLV